MRFRALPLAAGVAVLALTAGGVFASVDTKDQRQEGTSQWWDAGDYWTAQTFTAAVAGHLDKVSLMGLDTTGTITSIDLREGGPTGVLVGTSASADPVKNTWVDWDFPPTVQVTANSVYALVLHTSGDVTLGATCDDGAYTRGEASVSNDGVTWHSIPDLTRDDRCVTDLAFQEWVIPGAVSAPPTVSMAFGAASIPVGGSTSLIYTITNPNSVPKVDARPALPTLGTLTNISFTDTLPAGLLIATPNNIGGGCGGAITAVAGTNLVSITGLALAPETSCGFGLNVVGVAPGIQANTTSAITSTEGGSGDPATASITVIAPATPTPTPAPTTVVLGATAVPTTATTPPPTSTIDGHDSGRGAPLLPLLAFTAIAGLMVTRLLLRPETGARR